MNPTIERLRKTLPEYLTVPQYCDLVGCSRVTAYNDMRRVPGLGIKLGWRTLLDRNIALDIMAKATEPVPWTPNHHGGRPRKMRDQLAEEQQS
jgi:hypothetical protein